MKLKYTVISQLVTALLAYKHGYAVVSLDNQRVAIASGEALSKKGINPAEGDAKLCLADRITKMREALVGSHVTLRRDGNALFVTGIYPSRVEVLDITESDIQELCTQVARGGTLSREMKAIVHALRASRNEKYRRYLARFQEALTQGREDPAGLVDMRAQLQVNLVGHFV